MDPAETKDSPKDYGTDEAALVQMWLDQINLYDKEARKWISKGDKITKRYKDERDESDTTRKFNILWSNVETLKPSLYARVPAPECIRRYKDRDPVARAAAEIIERALEHEMESGEVDEVFKQSVLDYLLCGRGVPWIRYEADIEKTDIGDSLKDERVVVDYVHRKDFGHTPARFWKEVTAVWRRSYLTRKQLKERFGKEIAGKITLDHKKETDESDNDQFKKATVYEIWDKESRQTIWIAKSYKEKPLEVGPPHLDFEKFFPCPKPLYATLTNDSLFPIPDYTQYQDQAKELDEQTRKIHKLQEALKVVGVYAGEEKEALTNLLQAADLTMVPVEDWGEFSSKGGMAGVIQFVPIVDVVQALSACYDARDRAKQAIYEITGISDVLRGASDPGETATAQGIKAQWGGLRVRDRQADVQKYCRGVIRLMAEVIAEQFQPKTLHEMVNLNELKIDENGFEQALHILKSDRLRSFRIDIETDSTIEANEQEEKQSRTEFAGAIGGLMQNALPLVQAAPEMMPMISETILFVARGFKAGRSLEDAIEIAMEAAQAKIQQQMSQPPQPSPEEMKMKTDADLKKAEIDLKAQTAAADQNLKREEIAGNQALKQREIEGNFVLKAKQIELEEKAKDRTDG